MWLLRFLEKLVGTLESYPIIATIIKWSFISLGILILARIVWGFVTNPDKQFLKFKQRNPNSLGNDPWRSAYLFADSGDFESAIHALYAGIVQSLGESRLISVHQSKTAGEYLRELKRSNKPELAPQFLQFARRYESTVYRVAKFDRETFDVLEDLARQFKGAR